MDKFVIREKSVKAPSVGDDEPTPSGSATACENRVTGVNESEQVTKNIVPGKKRRSYQPSWSQKFTWIDYNKVKDVIFCKICKQIFEVNRFQFSHKMEKTFIETGFSNWKKGVEKLKAHESSGCHREAVLKFRSLKSNVNVFSQISKEKLTQMKENRACLLRIISSLRYLAVQGLAIRGHTNETSNFDSLMRLRCEDDQQLLLWLQRETYKWTSHDVQNQILAILSHTLLRKLLVDIKRAEYFAIIADETTDIATKEQFSVCIRFADVSLEIEEYFLGLYSTESTTAKALFDIIIDILRRFDLPVSSCRGQCFDGSANMAGLYNGVQAKLVEIEKKAVFVHCLAHSLNLTVQDTVKAVPECRNALNVLKDLIHFVKDSPKRLALFVQLKGDASTNLKPLCPTRWAIRYLAMSSVLSNYTELQDFFLTVSKNDSSETGAKANGFLINMQNFDFFFMLSVLIKLFGHIDTVNTALQRKSLHSEEASKIISTLVTSIKFMRNTFEAFWAEIISKYKDMDVDSPKLSRKRKIPKKYDDSVNSSVDAFTEVCDKYRRLYYETMDSSISCLESRFNTKSYMFVNQIEQFLLGDNKHSEYILSFYESDIDKQQLLLHRSMFHEIIQSSDAANISSLGDIVKYLRKEKHLVDLLPELVKFIHIVMTIPVTSCTAERSFSCLRRVKTYLRSVMRQDRLNAIALLNAHREESMKLDLDAICDEFISRNELRRSTFAAKN